MHHLLPQELVEFSIIVPVYNSGKTVENCLNSIICQHYVPRDIIIVDGGSTDGTLEILKSFASQFTNVTYLSEKDNGVYDAMNKGIQMATGNWCIFLGADDELIDENILSQVAKRLERSRSKLVYGNAKIIGDTLWAKDGEIYDGPFNEEKLFEKNICHQAVFYHTSIFQKLGYFNTRYHICADWEFNHRCFSKVDVEYIDLVISRFHAGGISSNDKADLFHKESMIILKKYYNISYFNNKFKSYSSVFFIEALKSKQNKKVIQWMYFYLIAFWHMDNKASFIKKLLRNLGKRFRR